MAMFTDLTHFIDDSGFITQSAPGPARKLGEWLAAIVESATAAERPDRWPTSVRCRRRPRRKACAGRIVVQLYKGEIRWICPECGDIGDITGFAGTVYDLSGCAPLDGRSFELPLNDDEYTLLLSEMDHHRDYLAVLRRAPYVDGLSLVWVPGGELGAFAESVLDCASVAPTQRMARILAAIGDRLDDERRSRRFADAGRPVDPEVQTPTDERFPNHLALGRWRITEMELWALDDVELLGEGFLELSADGLGRLRFIAVTGQLDWRPEGDRIDFSWVGSDEGDPVSGRGWLRVRADELSGRIYLHAGDDSGFTARRVQ